MKVVLLKEDKRTRDDYSKSIENAGHDVSLIANSSDFIEAVYANDADTYIVDMKAWFRGSAVYNYFDIPQKMNSVRTIFFNAPEGFKSIEKRESLPSDVVIEKDNNVELVISAL